jgi:hypothetical protein
MLEMSVLDDSSSQVLLNEVLTEIILVLLNYLLKNDCVARACEHGNDHSGCVKGEEFFD